MTDFLVHADDIFDITPSRRALDVTEAFESKSAVKPRSEGFLIPVHLFQKDNQCFNVQSDSRAEDVVEFKLKKLSLSSILTPYALYEVCLKLKSNSKLMRFSDIESRFIRTSNR